MAAKKNLLHGWLHYPDCDLTLPIVKMELRGGELILTGESPRQTRGPFTLGGRMCVEALDGSIVFQAVIGDNYVDAVVDGCIYVTQPLRWTGWFDLTPSIDLDEKWPELEPLFLEIEEMDADEQRQF